MSGKRSGLSIKDKMCILEKYDSLPKMSQREAATALNMPRTTLSKILKSREELEARLKSAAVANHNRKRNRAGKNKAVEDALKMWFDTARASNVPINGPILRQKAKDFSREMGFGEFTASEGWLDRWKKRENIVYHSQKTIHQEPKDSCPDAEARNWLKEVWPRIARQYRPQDIYAADETGLYFRALPESAEDGGMKDHVPSESIVVLCCVSMTGDKKQLLVVGKSRSPKCFGLPTRYEFNENAWMTSAIFQDWLTSWNAELSQEGRSICLMVDSCTAHNPGLRLTNIEIVILASLIQPCGRSVIRNLKALYRCEMQSRIGRWLDDTDGVEVTAQDAAKAIMMLDALHMLAKCWSLVSSVCIQNCFQDAIVAKISKMTDVGMHIPVVNVPAGMTLDEFNDWVDVDDSIPIASFLSESDRSIVRKVKNNGKNPENSEQDDSEQDVSDQDPTPTPHQMRAALRTIRAGLERRGFSDFSSFYRFEDLVEGAISESARVKFKDSDADAAQVSSELPGLVYLMQMTSQPMNTLGNHH